MAKKDKTTLTEPPKPWERQPGEPSTAFKAFCEYRNMGEGTRRRSMPKCIEKVTKSDGTLYSVATWKKWSSLYNWTKRADLWDDELDRQTREEIAKGRTSMVKNHIGIAQAMLTKALKALQRIPEDALTAQDIARMVDIASKLERLSRGDVTERTEGTRTVAGEVQANVSMQNIDFSGLTNGELEQLDEIVGKLASK